MRVDDDDPAVGATAEAVTAVAVGAAAVGAASVGSSSLRVDAAVVDSVVPTVAVAEECLPGLMVAVPGVREVTVAFGASTDVEGEPTPAWPPAVVSRVEAVDDAVLEEAVLEEAVLEEAVVEECAGPADDEESDVPSSA